MKIIVISRRGVSVFPVIRHITTVGGDAQNDIVLTEPSPKFWLRLTKRGEELKVEVLDKSAAPIINGKRQKSATLKRGDTICTSEEVLLIWEGKVDGSEKSEGSDIKYAAYKLFIEAAGKIAEQTELDKLLSALLDSLISLSKSEKGFIVLKGEAYGEWEVKFARNVEQKDIVDAKGHLSDSIVKKTLETGLPLVLSDALSNDQFSAARSIIALKLLSVMCIPLKARGELLGCIYIGNHSAINSFDEEVVLLTAALSAQAALLIKNALLINELTLSNSRLLAELESRRFGDIVGSSPAMQTVFALVRRVAPTDVSVLVEGETGTGKELIARELHRLSPRSGKPFVTINCGAIPENLLESELFGYRRGAFTGAVTDREGKVMAAQGGTLFLDEVSELPLTLQVKLLQLLQNRVITPIGDTKEYPVDIRVIAATNKTLSAEVEKGSFRTDLFYRLNVVSIKLPPLRERGEDIILLARYFLNIYAGQYNSPAKRIEKGALSAMLRYEWNGNVRELENLIRQAVVLARGTEITLGDLGLSEEGVVPFVSLAEAKNRFAKEYVQKAIERYGGNRAAAAEALGIDARTIRRILSESE
ncbi:MAG: hypothetical protein Kow0090_07020 [Myxococcota bacterium]